MDHPPTSGQRLVAAELRARAARDRFHATTAELQDRLDFRPRAEKARREMRIVGETAVAIARVDPGKTRGAVAGTVLAVVALLFRRRIFRLFVGKRPSPASAGLNPVTRINA